MLFVIAVLMEPSFCVHGGFLVISLISLFILQTCVSVAAGSGGGKRITVTADAQVSSASPVGFSYAGPTVTSVSTPGTDGSDSLTVTGTNFGPRTTIVSVAVPSRL